MSNSVAFWTVPNRLICPGHWNFTAKIKKVLANRDKLVTPAFKTIDQHLLICQALYYRSGIQSHIHSPWSVPIFLSNSVEKCSKSVLALYLSVCISIMRGDKRCTFLYVVLWAKAPLGKCMMGSLSASACHLGWIEVGICQWPPDFLCLYARRGQHWSGKSIHKVLLLGPGDGECKKLPILAKSWQIQKSQLCGILPLLLSIQGFSREKNFLKTCGLTSHREYLSWIFS